MKAPTPPRSPSGRGGDGEIVPAILRKTFENIEEDWNRVVHHAEHIQIDVTDGIFAGDGTFIDLPRLKKLPMHDKIELHMMVHNPADYVDDIIELNPARCVFHIESFLGTSDLPFVYNTVGEYTSSEMGLAINPDTPTERLTEYLPIIQYILFMGYNPGRANQPLNPLVIPKIATFHSTYPHIPIAVDGHVSKQTIGEYASVGASVFCANTAIFEQGDPGENIKQLELLARAGEP